MRRFAISYTQAINKQEHRRGSLFQEHPKRIRITDESHLCWLIHYIHQNPVHHGLVKDNRQWKYSSLLALSNNMSTKLHRKDVWQLFGSREEFQAFCQQKQSVNNIKYCLVDTKG